MMIRCAVGGSPCSLAMPTAAPNCGHAKRETMSIDACQFFYECESCRASLRPQPGDYCVFCSFGSMKCPPVQRQKPCCS
jgi:hypothetical protein